MLRWLARAASSIQTRSMPSVDLIPSGLRHRPKNVNSVFVLSPRISLSVLS